MSDTHYTDSLAVADATAPASPLGASGSPLQPADGVSAYTAAAIRVLDPAEAEERFGFARVAAWQRRYPINTQAFLARLMEACQLAGCDPLLAEQRYLAGDLSVEIPPELIEIHQGLSRHAAA